MGSWFPQAVTSGIHPNQLSIAIGATTLAGCANGNTVGTTSPCYGWTKTHLEELLLKLKDQHLGSIDVWRPDVHLAPKYKLKIRYE